MYRGLRFDLLLEKFQKTIEYDTSNQLVSSVFKSLTFEELVLQSNMSKAASERTEYNRLLKAVCDLIQISHY